MSDPMSDGAKTGTARMSDEWVADGNASHQDIMNLRDALTEALKVAGELAKAGEFLRQDLDIELSDRGKDSEKRCAVIEFREALAALERIRNNKH